MDELDPRLVEARRQEQLRQEVAARRRGRAVRRLVLIVFLVLIGLFVDGLREASLQKSLQVTSVLDAAQHYQAATKKWTTAKPGEAVLPGDGIRTSSAGRVHLKFSDGTLIKVDKASIFWVRSLDYDSASGVLNRQVILAAGRAWVRVIPGPASGSTLIMGSPAAMAQTSGARFSMEASPSATSVSTNAGEVEVSAGGVGQTVQVPAGQQVVFVLRSRRMPRPAKMQASEAAAWKAQGKDATGVLSNPPPSFRSWLTNAELMFMVKPAASLAGLFHGADTGVSSRVTGLLASDPNSAVKAQNEKAAWAAANRLQAAMSNSFRDISGYPGNIGLTDLSGVTISPADARSILSAFQGGRLLAYQKPSYGYKIYAQAIYPSTLIIEIDQNHVRSVSKVPPPGS